MAVDYGQSYQKAHADFVTMVQPTYGLEIGVEFGASAEAFLANTPNETRLVGVDPQAIGFERLNTQFNDRYMYIQGFSPEALDVVKGRKFDWIHIDGDHNYEAVVKDIEAAWPLLLPEGVMLFDDYGNPCGVKQAVDEFAAEHDLVAYDIPDHPHKAVYLIK